MTIDSSGSNCMRFLVLKTTLRRHKDTSYCISATSTMSNATKQVDIKINFNAAVHSHTKKEIGIVLSLRCQLEHRCGAEVTKTGNTLGDFKKTFLRPKVIKSNTLGNIMLLPFSPNNSKLIFRYFQHEQRNWISLEVDNFNKLEVAFTEAGYIWIYIFQGNFSKTTFFQAKRSTFRRLRNRFLLRLGKKIETHGTQ